MPSTKSFNGVSAFALVGLGTSMVAIRAAAMMKDSEFTINAISRPNSVDTIPPTAEPTITMIAHAEPLSALAEKSSELLTILGMLAKLAGAKKDADITRRIVAT